MRNDMKFLFIGDSITDGGRGRNGDPNHILGHGFAAYVSSTLGSCYAACRPKFYNRGNSGETSWEICRRWQTDVLDLAPDVLTLLCGVNDMLAFCRDPENPACSQAGFAANLREILARTRETLPETKVILGVPFFYDVTDVDDRFSTPDDLQEQRTTLRYRKVFTSGAAAKLADIAIRQETVRCIAAEYGCVLLDIPVLFEKAFTEAPPSYWIWDGVHPTYAMHGRIAGEWLRLWKGMDL